MARHYATKAKMEWSRYRWYLFPDLMI